MKPFLRFGFVILCGCLGLPRPVPAQLVAYDRFEEYSAGAQLESGAAGTQASGLEGGYGWGDPWDVNSAIKTLVRIENRSASPVNFSQGDLNIQGGVRALRFYDNANGTYAARRALGVSFSAAAREDLWFSFLFRTNNASPLADRDFFQAGFDDNPGASGGQPRLSIGAHTISTTFPPSQPFRFFARSTILASNSIFAGSPDIAPATTYCLVARISATGPTYDLVELFVNPSTLTVPSVPSAAVSVDSGLSSLTHFFLRTLTLEGGDAYVIDELKIGRSYASVVISEPPPLSLTFSSGPPGTVGTLRWPAILSTTLETSDTLDPTLWLPIPGPFDQDGDDHLWPVPDEPSVLRGFYRLRQR